MLCSMCNFKDAVCEKVIDLGYGKVDVYLCEACAVKVKSNENVKDEEISDFWNSGNMEVVCPRCKRRVSDFEQTSYVGCEKCYEVFKPEVERAISIIHGNTHHVGKVPEQVFAGQSNRFHKEKLSRDMDRAIDEDDFARARQIRDKYFGGDD